MKVVLLQDVKALGKKGDVAEVSEGYARNFLLAKKYAVEATPANLNTLKLQKANADRIAAEQLAEAKAAAEQLAKASVTVAIKAGETIAEILSPTRFALPRSLITPPHERAYSTSSRVIFVIPSV